MFRVTLSFVQSMLGSGFPSTVQLKIAVSPSIFTILSGCLVNPGASERGKVQDLLLRTRFLSRMFRTTFLIKKACEYEFSQWRKLCRHYFAGHKLQSLSHFVDA